MIPGGGVGFVEPHREQGAVDVNESAARRRVKPKKRKIIASRVKPPEPCEYLPSFNTAVFFRVPRVHCVAPMLARRRRRYSVFGWWLRERAALDVGHEEVPSLLREGATPPSKGSVDSSCAGDGASVSRSLEDEELAAETGRKQTSRDAAPEGQPARKRRKRNKAEA